MLGEIWYLLWNRKPFHNSHLICCCCCSVGFWARPSLLLLLIRFANNCLSFWLITFIHIAHIANTHVDSLTKVWPKFMKQTYAYKLTRRHVECLVYGVNEILCAKTITIVRHTEHNIIKFIIIGRTWRLRQRQHIHHPPHHHRYTGSNTRFFFRYLTGSGSLSVWVNYVLLCYFCFVSRSVAVCMHPFVIHPSILKQPGVKICSTLLDDAKKIEWMTREKKVSNACNSQ